MNVRTLRFKLSWTNGLFISIFFVLFGYIRYQTFAYRAQRNFESRLERQATSFANNFRATPEGFDWQPNLPPADAMALDTLRPFFVLTDLNGKVLREEFYGYYIRRMLKEKDLDDVLHVQSGFTDAEASDGRKFRFINRVLPSEHGQRIVLHLGRDLNEVTDLLHEYMSIYMYSVPLILIIAIGVGWFLAAHALKPFDDLAQTAERGTFDFIFLAEGLRLREQRGLIHDLDVVGRPNTVTMLAALAAVTTKLGLAGTLSATYNEPYDLARQFASLAQLSGGRSAWNVVTSPDAFTGENFRRGGYLDPALRYERAREFVQTAREIWDSWQDQDIIGDRVTGRFLRDDTVGRFSHQGPQFDINGRFPVPRSPQGYPVQLQAGDSDGGRELAASSADVIFTRHTTFDAVRTFSTNVKRRLPRYGRAPEDLKILPGATFALGDTESEAREVAHHVRRQQVSPQTAILLLEQLWNRDLSAYDPEGPLPTVDPDVSADSIIKGRTRIAPDALAVDLG